MYLEIPQPNPDPNNLTNPNPNTNPNANPNPNPSLKHNTNPQTGYMACGRNLRNFFFVPYRWTCLSTFIASTIVDVCL